MKLLLLCLGLTLVCAHHHENHEIVTSHFDMSKISGEWYTILLASDANEKIEENGRFRMFLEYIEPLGTSGLSLKYHAKLNGECTKLIFFGDETTQEGIYSVAYDGDNNFHIVETDYDDYLILYTLNSKGGENTQILELFARTQDVRLEIKKRFEEISPNYGIPVENVLDVTNADPCSVV